MKKLNLIYHEGKMSCFTASVSAVKLQGKNTAPPKMLPSTRKIQQTGSGGSGYYKAHQTTVRWFTPSSLSPLHEAKAVSTSCTCRSLSAGDAGGHICLNTHLRLSTRVAPVSEAVKKVLRAQDKWKLQSRRRTIVRLLGDRG